MEAKNIIYLNNYIALPTNQLPTSSTGNTCFNFGYEASKVLIIIIAHYLRL